jgi:outer membrane protein assembly factor BamB
MKRLLLLAPLLFCSSALSDDWPDFLGPKRRGISEETGWNAEWNSKEPEVLWKAKVGPGVSSCTVSGGRVYTMGCEGDEESVICLDAGTGDEIWRQTYECEFDRRSFKTGGPAGTPVIDGDRIYTLSFRGQLFCWQATDGEKLWESHLENDFKGVMPRWGWAGNPLVLGNMLIVEPGGNGSSRAAVDKLTGKVFWQSGNDPASYSSPIIFRGDDMRGAALFHGNGLTCVNPRDGTELFRHEWKTDYGVNAATLIHREGRFLLASGYGTGIAQVDLKSGVTWQHRDIMMHFQSPVLYGDHLYFISGDNNQPGRLQCLDWATGEVKWSQGAGGKRGGVIVAGGKLIAVTEPGEVILAEATPSGYVELGRTHPLAGDVWAAPAFSDRRLVVRNNAGLLVCLDLSP